MVRMQSTPAWHGVHHYENFPVASRLLPARMRPAVIALYDFARHADDLADEGDGPPAIRSQGLIALREALLAGPTNTAAQPPVVAALWPHLSAHGLSIQPLLDLLSAFLQDVEGFEYRTRADTLDYCRRSANPVGRLMLQLFGLGEGDTLTRPADSICTALQVINFMQDLAGDVRRGRIYLPADRLAAAGLQSDDLHEAVARGRAGPQLARVIADECAWARGLLDLGRPLVRHVPWRFSLELRAILAGGTRILDQLKAAGHDPIRQRPRLGLRDALPLMTLFARAAR